MVAYVLPCGWASGCCCVWMHEAERSLGLAFLSLTGGACHRRPTCLGLVGAGASRDGDLCRLGDDCAVLGNDRGGHRQGLVVRVGDGPQGMYEVTVDALCNARTSGDGRRQV